MAFGEGEVPPEPPVSLDTQSLMRAGGSLAVTRRTITFTFMIVLPRGNVFLPGKCKSENAKWQSQNEEVDKHTVVVDCRNVHPMFGWPFAGWRRPSQSSFSPATSGPAAGGTATVCHRLPKTCQHLSPSAIICHDLSVLGRSEGVWLGRLLAAIPTMRALINRRWFGGARESGATNGAAKVLVWGLSNRCSRKTLGRNKEDGNELLQADHDRSHYPRMGDDPLAAACPIDGSGIGQDQWREGLKDLWGTVTVCHIAPVAECEGGGKRGKS